MSGTRGFESWHHNLLVCDLGGVAESRCLCSSLRWGRQRRQERVVLTLKGRRSCRLNNGRSSTKYAFNKQESSF